MLALQVLGNARKLSLAAFQAHCARELTLESLLFYLEVQVFREMILMAPDEPPRSSVDLGHYARYIYDTYVDVDAPLQINLSEEVREEVAATDRYWAGMFDEAQDMVRALMKRHSYVRFEASDGYARLQRMRQQDPARFEAAEIKQSLVKLFPPSNELLAGIEETTKLRSSSS
ncbi:RGS domain-containing protein, partial [Thamnocephalis sphaerospora]